MKKIIFSLSVFLFISTCTIVAVIPPNNINNTTKYLLEIVVTRKTDCTGYPPTDTATYNIQANQSDVIFLGTDDPQYASLCLPRVTSLKAILVDANASPVTIQNSQGIAIKDYTVSLGRTAQGAPQLVIE